MQEGWAQLRTGQGRGGQHPRKIYFFPHTGQVLVKRMERTHNDTLLLRERAYLQEVRRTPQVGDVELFT